MNTAVIFRLLSDMKKTHIGDVLEELTLIEFMTLHVLKRGMSMNQGREITVSDLADYTDSSLPSVSRTLKLLEEADLIARKIGKVDRRVISVVLTEKGESLLTQEETRLKEYSHFIYEKMGVEDIKELDALSSGFRKASDEAFIAYKEQKITEKSKDK